MAKVDMLAAIRSWLSLVSTDGKVLVWQTIPTYMYMYRNRIHTGNNYDNKKNLQDKNFA